MRIAGCYDSENRLTGVSGGATATFVYDGDGNRVKATVGGATTGCVGNYYEVGATTKKYYYLAGQRVAMLDGTTRSCLLSDQLGSQAITANSSGALVAELRYKAWGENRYTNGTTPTTYHFTGQREESGLGAGVYFYGARWYDAALGRFLEADTIIPSADNPQSLNRYSYTYNSPLRYTDPTGHRVCADPCDTESTSSEKDGDDLAGSDSSEVGSVVAQYASIIVMVEVRRGIPRGYLGAIVKHEATIDLCISL